LNPEELIESLETEQMPAFLRTMGYLLIVKQLAAMDRNN
jgi:hypothetical protein